MSILFDGSNDDILLPNITIPNATTGIVTYTFWLRLAAGGGAERRPWGSASNNECTLESDNRVTNDTFEPPGGIRATTISALTIGVWAFIASTADANIDTAKIYFDGVLEDTDTNHTGTAVGTDMSFGTRTGKTDRFPGAIDDWRMYDRILATEEIETIFALRGSDGIVEGLLHRFTFREAAPGASVVTLVDVAGNGGGGGETVNGDPTFEESVLELARAA